MIGWEDAHKSWYSVTVHGLLGIAVIEEAERVGFLSESNNLTPSEKMKLTRLMDGDFQNPV